MLWSRVFLLEETMDLHRVHPNHLHRNPCERFAISTNNRDLFVTLACKGFGRNILRHALIQYCSAIYEDIEKCEYSRVE